MRKQFFLSYISPPPHHLGVLGPRGCPDLGVQRSVQGTDFPTVESSITTLTPGAPQKSILISQRMRSCLSFYLSKHSIALKVIIFIPQLFIEHILCTKLYSKALGIQQ